jgi:CubicO group peptidase (beta-lactamase class C family)
MKALLLAGACLVSARCMAADLTRAEKAAIDTAVTDTLHAADVPGASIAVVKEGRLVYAQAYGYAELPSRKAAPAMAFPIGSVSKQFTASLILLLAQDGKLSLNDKVGRFLPDLSGAQQVTLRQILSHTAGYEDFAPEDYTTPPMTRPTKPEAVVAEWGRKKLDFTPGTAWQYSNTGYTIAGLVAQKAGGAPFFEQLRTRILTPLHLRSAVDYDAHGVPPGGPVGYQRYALGPPRLAQPDEPGWSFGSGDLAMTASDLATWDVSLMFRSLLSPASYDGLETPIRLTGGADTAYGLGVHLRVAGKHRAIEHTGEETGFTAYNEVFPDDREAVAVLVNEDATPASALIGQQIEAIAFGIPPAEPSDPSAARLVRMLADLTNGKIDPAHLNANARFYFSPAVLSDYRNSLSALGPLVGIRETEHEARGGMVFHLYAADYLKRRVEVTTYELPDGRLGQLLVGP